MSSWSADPSAANQSSVYTVLERLGKSGDAEVVGVVAPEPGSGGGNRSIWALTANAEARHEHDRWRTTKPTTEEGLRLRLAFMTPEDLGPLTGWVAEEVARIQRLLSNAPAEHSGTLTGGEDWQQITALMMSRRAYHEASATLEWLIEVQAYMQKLGRLVAGKVEAK